MLKKLTILLLALGLCVTFGLGKAKADPITSEGGLGDLLLFPLYDVRETAQRTDGWQNYLTIQNTSNQWTACHLRFRTWRKSIEVYDHVILLSPFDVFWAVIERQADGSVEIRSDDTETCLNSGLIYPPDTSWSTAFQTYLLEECGYGPPDYVLNEELQAGYVEIIGLWQLSRAFPIVAAPAEDTHVLANVVLDLYNDGHAGNINVYDVLDGLFYDWNAPITVNYVGLPAEPDWPWIGPPAHQDVVNEVTLIAGLAEDPNLPAQPRWGVDCGNVLLANMAIGDITTGQFELGNFTALADFRTENWLPVPGPNVPGLHRDTHDFGAILFHTEDMFWWPYDRNGNRVGVSPYINENWATTVGPGLRDGDDLNVDRTGAGVVMFNWTPVDCAQFNDIYSLDDVERLLVKDQIWYNYFNDPWGSNYQTDFVVTFPSKHYHWFFDDWTFWNDSDIVAPFAPEYIAYPWVPTAPYATLADYWNAVQTYRGIDAEPDGGALNGSIAFRFDTVYANGPISAGATVWNVDQDTVAGGEPPPGSPWVPVAPKPIPHEANIISVGTSTGTGIEEGNGLLDTTYEMGQFLVGAITVIGQRYNAAGPPGHILYDPTGAGLGPPYMIPPIGVMIYDLNYSGADFRSTMAPWDYIFEFWP